LPRQVCPRDGLIPANQIQHDAAIDIARGLAGSDLKTCEIDLPHVP